MNVFTHIFIRFYCRNNRHPFFTGFPVINSVNIAQYHQRLHIHHGSHQSGQLIIIGKHQFRNTDGIIFIHNRQHPILQHHHHAVALVQIVTTGGETFFHGQHLTYSDVMLTKQFIITINQFGLTNGRKQLSLIDMIHPSTLLLRKLQLTAPTCHSTGRNQNDLDTTISQFRYLINQSRHPCNIQSAISTCQHITAHLDRYSLVFRLHLILYYLDARNPSITLAVKPASSMAFKPLMVIPPGVVTRSISVSGCEPFA